jgi:hypothetical protein
VVGGPRKLGGLTTKSSLFEAELHFSIMKIEQKM